jgi:hypothetical protein
MGVGAVERWWFMVLVKDFVVLNLHPMLVDIIEMVEDEFGPGLYTSVYRAGDAGVHGQMPVRGIDRRCRNAASGLSVANWVAAGWIYDPARPEMVCCIFHDTGQGWHLHFQVHPNTVRRSGR